MSLVAPMLAGTPTNMYIPSCAFWCGDVWTSRKSHPFFSVPISLLYRCNRGAAELNFNEKIMWNWKRKIIKSSVKSNEKFNETRKRRGGYLKHIKVSVLGAVATVCTSATAVISAVPAETPLSSSVCLPFSRLPGLLLYSKWSRMMHCNASPSPLVHILTAHTHTYTQKNTLYERTCVRYAIHNTCINDRNGQK